MILRSVYLPQPEGPTSETSSPGSTSKVASEIAKCWPYVFRTPARWMNGSRNARILCDEDAFEDEDQSVQQHANERDEKHRHEHRRRVERHLDLEHEIAQTLVRAEELADDRARDREDGADLHAREDVRQRAGQLDLGEELPARAFQRAHEVEELGLDLAQPARGGEQIGR